jgi:hypothetical protein
MVYLASAFAESSPVINELMSPRTSFRKPALNDGEDRAKPRRRRVGQLKAVGSLPADQRRQQRRCANEVGNVVQEALGLLQVRRDDQRAKAFTHSRPGATGGQIRHQCSECPAFPASSSGHKPCLLDAMAWWCAAREFVEARRFRFGQRLADRGEQQRAPGCPAITAKATLAAKQIRVGERGAQAE